MNYLIDTHVLIWALSSPGKISRKVQKILLNPESEIYVSILSFWEISLKYSLNKLEFKGLNPNELPVWAEKSGFHTLNLTAEDASSFHKLPKSSYKDPFDRMLVWQSIQNKLTLLSQDKSLKAYQDSGLKSLW